MFLNNAIFFVTVLASLICQAFPKKLAMLSLLEGGYQVDNIQW
jgi:hypothetical protein